MSHLVRGMTNKQYLIKATTLFTHRFSQEPISPLSYFETVLNKMVGQRNCFAKLNNSKRKCQKEMVSIFLGSAKCIL